jgi:DNA modification methylase
MIIEKESLLNKIWNEPCLETLKRMEDNSIDSVVTSPPYWMKRDYGYPEQWGLEPTFYLYLEHLWSMMDEVKRVLKPTGTVFINLGDTYNGTKNGNTSNKGYIEDTTIDTFTKQKQNIIPNKCLLFLPHRFGIGCIDRGWIARNDICWGKRNRQGYCKLQLLSVQYGRYFY